MKMKQLRRFSKFLVVGGRLCLLSLFFFAERSPALWAQTNVRGWYADGQVWIVWEAAAPLPETYAIYASPAPFTHTNDAVQVGRLFLFEYGPGALREQVDSAATFRIPDGQGGIYQLADNEGLFVATPHQAGALWFAVAPWGETAVTPGVNLTQTAVPFQYDPAGDPVECHLQATFPSPFAAGFICYAFYLWADGRQNQWDNRPDFPVMANEAKNGMPSLFLVSVPVDLDTTTAVPLTIWLHGGGGTARQSLAGSRAIVNINPEIGILVAHNDDLLGWRGDTPPYPDQPSWHFGWRKNWDPFNPDNFPTAPDTVVNYTQRRYRWIDQWLIGHYPIDPNRININGHSMGSAGATALAKVYPGHYASATIFNNGFGGPVNDEAVATFGPTDAHYPTNLVNRTGQTVDFPAVFNLLDNCSPERDLPLFRAYCGKNDYNDAMMWDAYVVENYRKADSLGMGMQLYWSERTHDIGGPGDHWAYGNGPTEQTLRDNVAYEEAWLRSDVSFPAFFNHRLDPNNNDPGDGTPGTGPAGVGDDWGTWGGYHLWNPQTLTDEPGEWAINALLAGFLFEFANDGCSDNALTADMAIRKPRNFKPAPGKILHWSVSATSNPQVFQTGTTVVQADSLVVIPGVELAKSNYDFRRIRVQDLSVSAAQPGGDDFFSISKIEPNPAATTAGLTVFVKNETTAEISATGAGGRVFSLQTRLLAGENHVSLAAFDAAPGGFYVVEIRAGGRRQALKWIKM